MSGTLKITQGGQTASATALAKPVTRQGRIQSKINKGGGIAARYLGAPYKQYRPVDPLVPIDTMLGSVMADFDIDPKFSHRAPSKYGNPIYYGLFDSTYIRVGDYLIGPEGETYFIAGMEPNKPPICVVCNRIVSFHRPRPRPVGNGYYGGDIRGGGEADTLVGWPASALQGTKGEKTGTELPGDVRQPWNSVLLPAIAGTDIVMNDRMSDDLGHYWTVSSAERTDLGWRLTTIQTEP